MPAPDASPPRAPLLPFPFDEVPPAALSPPVATLSEKVELITTASNVLYNPAPEPAPAEPPIPGNPGKGPVPEVPPLPPLPPDTVLPANVVESMNTVPTL